MNPKHNPATGGKKLSAAERQAKAVELRKAGASLDAIARQLGYANRSSAYKAIRAWLDQVVVAPAADLKKLYDERYEALIMAHWTNARAGDFQAATIVLRALEALRQLHGTDAPKRLAVDMEPMIRKMAEAAGLADDETEQAVMEAERLVKEAGLNLKG